MLKVNIKFVADELTPGLINGEYEIGEGSSVRELLKQCESACGVSVSEGNFKLMYPIFNGKPLGLDSVIPQGGTLHLCRIVMGG